VGNRLRAWLAAAALWCPAAAALDCPDQTTAGMRRCLSEELGRLELQLEATLLKSREAATEAAILDQAQSAWRRYIEADCRAAADVYRGGTLAPVVELSCRIDHLKARIRHLRDDYLERDGGAPGRREAGPEKK
jgi:uncharacterized protein YecT (DUF1311 family)